MEYVISSGITSSDIILKDDDLMQIYSGGTANNTIVSSHGCLYIYSKGVANNTTLNKPYDYNEEVVVSSGGTMNITTINGGNLLLRSGGTANSTIINSSGSMFISSGGKANSITVNYGGKLSVPYGGGNYILENGGNVWVDSKSIVSFVPNSINELTISKNTTTVHSGTTANNTIVNTSGYLVLFSGGIANNNSISAGGFMFISSGGMANNTVVNSGGFLEVSSGGTAMEIVENGGYVSLGEKSAAIIKANSFSDLILNDKDSATIHSGTTGNNITVNAGAKLVVYSGGTANDIVWTPCNGHVQIEDGAQATFISPFAGVYYGEDGILLSSDAIMDNKTIQDKEEVYVMSDGVINSTTIQSSGNMCVADHGFADNTEINSLGKLSISSGGTAYNNVVKNGGLLCVKSGGTATAIVASSGALLDFAVAPSTYIQGTYADSAFEIKKGSATLFSVNSGISLHVLSGGVANRVTMYGGGFFDVLNEGEANRTLVSGGTARVFSGGTMNSTTIDGGDDWYTAGRMYVYSGGIMNNTTINYPGSMWISSGGIANNTTIKDAGYLMVSAGGTATNITALSGAWLNCVVASDTYVTGTYDGEIFEIRDGIASNFRTTMSGHLYVSSGCTANNTLLDPAGELHIYSGGVANNTIAKGYTAHGGIAYVYLSNGGIANNTRIGSGSYLVINQGGIANNTIVNSDSKRYDSDAWGVQISSGGIANNTIINSNGWLWLESGGVASDVIINSGGTLSIQAKLTGKITLEEGAALLVSQGAVIDFDISRLAPEMGARVNNLSLFTERAPAFTLTISDKQWNGIYALAEGVNEFDNLVSIKNTSNETIQMVEVGETANIDGVDYTLNLVDNTLTVTVTGGQDIPVIPITADITALTNQDVTLTAGFSDDAIMREYSFDRDTWHVYAEPVKCEVNGTVYFLGKDQRGYVCETASYEVSNIDKVAPGKPTATADIKTSTNGKVLVSATFSEDSVVKEYSTDGKKTWLDYVDAIVFEENGTVYFRGKDSVGNESEIVSYTVKNIDKIAPAKPTVSANITTPTNKSVSVTATFSTDSKVKEYSLNGETWQTYTKAIVFNENGIVYFRGKDSAGNESEISSYMVDYIDKIAPEKPTVSTDITTLTNQNVNVSAVFSEDTVKKEYKLNSGNWQTYSASVKLTSNGTVSFRGTDAAGNISEVASYNVNYIDKTAPVKPTATANTTDPTNQDVIVTATFSDDSVVKEYSLDGEKWIAYTEPVIFTENGTVYFRGADAAGNVSVVTSYEITNIEKVVPDTIAPTAPAGLDTVVSGQKVALVWDVSTDDSSGVKEYVVTYSLGGQEFTVRTNGTSYVLNNADLGSYSWSVQAVDFAGNESAVTAGGAFTVSGFKPYTVEYSADNFEHVIRFAVTTQTLDAFRMPTGTYQLRVRQEGDSEWLTGDTIVAAEIDDAPQLIKSDADGNADVFFANTVGTWESGYLAQHVGSVGNWTGTDEYAMLFGKNKLADIIEGSIDANILLMTDETNGDALFVDDIYTASWGNVAEKQARIAQINEIRAGAGSDIVDMTSQRFEYIGNGLTIRGGEGNDVLWSSTGDNKLFGDAGDDRIVGASGDDVIVGGIGNDRMHGGGGNDVFTFCDNWGLDNVEQLSGGSVTLWFVSGSEANWNESTLTYSDGMNSIKVSGVAADKITLKFGDDGSDQFASLMNVGAFFDATSERIFEESGKGILASL